MRTQQLNRGIAVAAIVVVVIVVALLASRGGTGGTPGGSTSPSATTTAAASAPASAGGSASPAGSGATGGTIKIGGGFALTGDESSLDLPAANGAKLAVKEINAAGGVLGSQIDFIVHDSQYKMDVTAQIAKQFVEQDKVIALIGFTDT